MSSEHGEVIFGTDEEKPKRSRAGCCLRVLIRTALALLAIAALAAAGVGVLGYLAYDRITGTGAPGEKVHVEIPEGATGRSAGQILSSAGLIEHEFMLRGAMHLDKTGKTIKHGAYELPKGLSAMQYLELLDKGPNAVFDAGGIPPERRLTVPEGLSINQMAALFDDPEAFKEAAADPGLRTRMGVRAATLEGFLMPDTYYFDQKPTPREAVERMASQFEREFAELLALYPLPADYDRDAVVAVASLVEEEAKVDEERPLVAAVIYNRLKKGIPLGMDSTLQFSLNKYGQRMLDADKEVDSPYNTYKNAGLPPGPICSPGLAALRAALDPARENYLYFVSNADGRTHTFSKTLEEHNRAVSRFRKEIRVQRRQLKQDTDGN